jgi:hypothetical protein
MKEVRMTEAHKPDKEITHPEDGRPSETPGLDYIHEHYGSTDKPSEPTDDVKQGEAG